MTDRELKYVVLGLLGLLGMIIILKYVDFTSDRLILVKNHCLREINKQYIDSHRETYYIYRVEKVRGDQYFLAVYANRDWVNMGPKKIDYFKEGKIFRFENTKCPGKPKGDKLEDRLKDLEFHL